MIDDIWRERSEGWQRTARQFSVGIIFNNQHAIFPGDGDDSFTPLQRHGRRGGIMKRRRAIEQPRLLGAANALESLGIQPLRVDRDMRERNSEMLGKRTETWIGQCLDSNRGAVFPEERDQRQQGTLRTGADQ